MSADIDTVLRSLEVALRNLEGEADEPRVIVDPGLEAFCLMGTRMARGTVPPRSSSSGRVPLAAILAYLGENADEDDDKADEAD